MQLQLTRRPASMCVHDSFVYMSYYQMFPFSKILPIITNNYTSHGHVNNLRER
jgi:hypothetical protein